MCIVISECATSAVCVCGIDRRERVCVLLLATPNRPVLYLDTLESATCWTSGKRAFRATVKQNWCVKETTTNSLHGGRTRDAVRYVHRSGPGRCGLPLPAGPRCSRWVCPDGFNGGASATRAPPEGWRSCPARLQPRGQPSQQRPVPLPFRPELVCERRTVGHALSNTRRHATRQQWRVTAAWRGNHLAHGRWPWRHGVSLKTTLTTSHLTKQRMLYNRALDQMMPDHASVA